MSTQVTTSTSRSRVMLTLRADDGELRQARRNPELVELCRCKGLRDVDVLSEATSETEDTSRFVKVELRSDASCSFCTLLRHRLTKCRSIFPLDLTPQSSIAFLYDDQLLGRILVRDEDGRKCGVIRLESRGKSGPPARRIGTSPDVDYARIRYWFRQCETNHGANCNLGTFATARYRRYIGLTLIDVTALCLVEATSEERYAAFSYVWGCVPTCELTQGNFRTLHKAGSLLSLNLPNATEDAIRMTKRLGFQYLWVDRLCIIQDAAAKHQLLSQMDVIYSHAFFTIAAIDGKDANTPLPGIRPASRLPVLRREIIDEHIYVSEPPSLHSALSKSVYEGRGWTLQERALSRRLIYVSDQQIYFACNVSTRSESHPHENFSKGSSQQSPWLWTIGNRLNAIRLRANVEDESWADDQVDKMNKLRRRWIEDLATYQDLVEIYTKRTLTFEADVLDAFAGFGSVFQESSEGSLVFGLPVSILCISLLWISASKASPNRRKGNGTTNQPTWSWSGWLGACEYPSINRLVSQADNMKESMNIFSRIEDVKINFSASTSKTYEEADLVQTNNPATQIHQIDHLLGLKPPALSFSAPTISCDQFTFILGKTNIIIQHKTIHAITSCGVVLDSITLDVLGASNDLCMVLLSHDFEPLHRTQLRTTYGITSPSGYQDPNPHSLNVLIIKEIDGGYNRIALAKLYSETWPRPSANPSQRRVISLR